MEGCESAFVSFRSHPKKLDLFLISSQQVFNFCRVIAFEPIFQDARKFAARPIGMKRFVGTRSEMNRVGNLNSDSINRRSFKRFVALPICFEAKTRRHSVLV